MRVVVDASAVLAWFLPELPEPKALASRLSGWDARCGTPRMSNSRTSKVWN